MPGIPRRRLDDRAAGPEEAGLLGSLDHGQPDAVLHRAARVERLELRKDERLAFQRPEVAWDPRQPDERGVADEVENGLGILHPAEDIGPGRGEGRQMQSRT